MKFCIGPIDFELSAKFNSIRNQLKECYNNDVANRAATVKLYRQLTKAPLLDAIDYCNEHVFNPEHRTARYYETR